MLSPAQITNSNGDWLYSSAIFAAIASSSLPPVPKSPITAKRVLLNGEPANSETGSITVPAARAASDFNAVLRETREERFLDIGSDGRPATGYSASQFRLCPVAATLPSAAIRHS